MMRFDEYYDAVIVGTGAAGLYCALNFPKRYKVLLLTKQKADECDSFLAQGGICMQHGEADYRSFFEDTMRAGHYENDAATVDLMIRSSNSIIRDLVRRGVRFSRTKTVHCALPARARTPAHGSSFMRTSPGVRSPRPSLRRSCGARTSSCARIP